MTVKKNHSAAEGGHMLLFKFGIIKYILHSWEGDSKKKCHPSEYAEYANHIPKGDIFGHFFLKKNPSFKIAMSGWAIFRHWASSQVNLLVNLFSKLYVTFILLWIAFIFGRDTEEDQLMYPMQERQLSLPSLFKKPIHNAVRHFSCYYALSGM